MAAKLDEKTYTLEHELTLMKRSQYDLFNPTPTLIDQILCYQALNKVVEIQKREQYSFSPPRVYDIIVVKNNNC